MPDTPTPQPPPPISGYRSRAINAVADFAGRLRPVAGRGVRIADGPGGKIISLDTPARAERPRAWRPSIGLAPGEATGSVAPYLRVPAGRVVWRDALGDRLLNAAVPGDTPDLLDMDPVPRADGGVDYVVRNLGALQEGDYICVRAGRVYASSESEPAAPTIWGLAPSPDPVAIDNGVVVGVAIACVVDQLRVEPLEQPGVIVLGVSALGANLMPFDLAVLDGAPCVYLPSGAEIVFVRGGIVRDAVRDASATPGQGDGDWVRLEAPEGASVGGVWAWVKWDGNAQTPGYSWGVATSDPLNQTSAGERYLASVLVGVFARDSATNATVVDAQLYHGNLVVYDDHGDDLAVERDGCTEALSLRAFQDGNSTGEDWDDVDYVLREERDGEYPNQQYRVNYISGSTLRAAIERLVSAIIAETIHEIIVEAGGSTGDDPAILVATLDARYQPICTEAEPSWGVATGAWTQSRPSDLSGELAGIDAALQALDARVTALENPNAAP